MTILAAIIGAATLIPRGALAWNPKPLIAPASDQIDSPADSKPADDSPSVLKEPV